MLNLDSLELRRLRWNLALAYEIMFGQVDVDPSNFFVFQHNEGHDYRLIGNNSRIESTGKLPPF